MTLSDEEIEREKSRDRGILSGSDREALLRTEEDYLERKSRQALGQANRRIQDRVRDGLRDMTLLFNHLDDDEIAQIFSLAGTPTDRDPMLNGVSDAMALFYFALGGRSEPFDFETRLQRAVRSSRRREYGRGGHRPIDVTLEVEELPVSTIEEIAYRLDRGEYDNLSEGELRFVVSTLFETEAVSADVYREAENKNRQELADSLSELFAEAVEKRGWTDSDEDEE